MTFNLVFAMGPSGGGAISWAPPAEARTTQRWVGQLLSGRPDAPPPGEPRHLLLCDMPAGARLAPMDGLWTWIGKQVLPGDAEAPVGAGGLLLNLMNIDDAHEAEFNEWYDTEHVARIAQVEGVLAARRFHSAEGQPHYAAVYHLRDLELASGDAWRAAVSTPWSARMLRYRFGNLRMGFTPVV